MNEKNKMVMSYRKMRRIVGLLGILLPFALVIGNYAVNNLDILNNNWFVLAKEGCPSSFVAEDVIKQSISHFYYSSVGELFVGVLCAVAFFLFCYRGYPKPPKTQGKLIIIPSDSVMTNLAGLCALGVAIFPTGNDSQCIGDNLRIFVSTDNTGKIHLLFAATLFILLALISRINFRREGNPDDFNEKDNHPFYNFCGWVILISIGLIVIYFEFFEEQYQELQKYNIVFWLETVALIAFGSSWLKKGKVNFNYFKGRKSQTTTTK